MNKFQTNYTEVMEITKVFGQNLRFLRESEGVSAEQFGVAIGVTKKHVLDLEKGRKNPSIELIEKISVALNVSASQLFANGIKPNESVKILPMSVLAKRLAAIPDEVYQYGPEIPPNDKIWKYVVGAIKERAAQIEKEKKSAKA